MSLNKDLKQKSKTVWQISAMLFLSIVASVFVLIASTGVKSNYVLADEVTLPTSALSGFVPAGSGDFELVDSGQPNSINNPYKINNEDDLRTLAYWVNTKFEETELENLAKQELYTRASFRLENHLNISQWNWEPIGTQQNPFLGNFNGNGYSIYGLTIIDDLTQTQADEGDVGVLDETYAGLFGLVSYAIEEETEYAPVIQLLGLKDTVIVTNRTYVGSIVACGIGADPNLYAEKTVLFQNTTEVTGTSTYSNAQGPLVIQDCYNVGYIQGGQNVGGLAGALFYGAVVYNCYNAPMNKIAYNQNYDVYSANQEANVGGLVGSAEYTTKAVVYKCFNSALVSRADVEVLREAGSTNEISQSTSIANIGFIIGSKNYIGASSLYSSNIYVKYSYTFKGDYGFTENFSIMQSDFDLFNIKWSSIERFNADTWSNNSSKIWCMQPNVNNGLPVLYNVPQLVKYNFVSQDPEGMEIATTDASGTNDTTMSPALVDETNGYVFYEQGSTPLFTTKVDAKQKYVFKQWNMLYTTDSVKNWSVFERVSNLESAQFFTNHDATLISVFDYREYTISLAINSENYNASESTIKIGEQSITLADQLAGSYIKANYLDVVEFNLVPNAGFEVASWNCEYPDALLSDGATATLSLSTFLDKYLETNGSTNLPTSISVTALLEAKTYTFTTNANLDSVGTVAVYSEGVEYNEGTVTFGKNLELKATVTDASYEFIGWEVNGEIVSQMPTYSFTVSDYENGSLQITGVFEKKKYSVVLTQTNGGSVAVTTPATGVYYYGDTITITAVPEYGYELNGFTLSIGGQNVDLTSVDDSVAKVDLANGTLTIYNITDNIACSAVFNPISFDFTVILSHENGASVYNGANTEENSLLGTHSFVYKQYITLGIELAEGYKLISITDENNENYFSGHSIQILKDTVLTITLEQIKFTVSVSISVDDKTYNLQNDCIEGAGEYVYGSEVRVAINYPEMFDFAYWEVEGNTIENAVIDNVNAVFTCPRILQHITLKAHLKVKTVSLTFDVRGLNTDGDWYKVNGSTIKSKYTIKKQYRTQIDVELISLSNVSSTFSYWEVNGVPVSQESYYSFIAESEDLNITAVYVPTNYSVSTYVVRWNTDSNIYDSLEDAGTISGLSANMVEYGKTITLTATAKDGYKFVGWYVWDYTSTNSRGAKITAEATLEYEITKDTRIYANFERISKVVISMSDSNAGTVTGAGEYLAGESVTVTAKANQGYRFVCWKESGEVVSNNANYTFTTNRNDRTITAEFEPVFTIALKTNNDSYGKVVGNTTGKYRENVVLQAVSENNCSFVGWVINDVVVSTADTLSLNLNGNMEVYALFKKNFDWNILIILAGCFLFAIVLIAGSAAYIKMRESEPMPVRVLMSSKDDKELLQKPQKRKRYRDTIEPVPTRKNTKANVAPIPVRKITVAPINHKGELVGRKQKAIEEKPTLNTEIKDKKAEVEEKNLETKVAKTTATKSKTNSKAKTKNSSKKSKSSGKKTNKKSNSKKK